MVDRRLNSLDKTARDRPTSATSVPRVWWLRGAHPSKASRAIGSSWSSVRVWSGSCSFSLPFTLLPVDRTVSDLSTDAMMSTGVGPGGIRSRLAPDDFFLIRSAIVRVHRWKSSSTCSAVADGRLARAGRLDGFGENGTGGSTSSGTSAGSGAYPVRPIGLVREVSGVGAMRPTLADGSCASARDPQSRQRHDLRDRWRVQPPGSRKQQTVQRS